MPFFDPIRIGASKVADTDFSISRSLKFNDFDSPYLNRTPSSASNRRTFTFSVWVKRGDLSLYSTIIGMYNDSNNQFVIRFQDTDELRIFDYQSGSFDLELETDAVFRDPAAWYHIVVAVDTTDASASNRCKVYINNNQITEFNTATYPSQNHDTLINDTNAHLIGQKNTAHYFDGLLTEFNFIDGQQLTPSSFAETNATTGQWVPKDTSGLTFGTNGYRLQFADNSGTTATTLGKDTSGNSNNFTPNNFSVSAGITNDSFTDTPTNNFCVMNPLHQDSNTRLANGNLQASGTSASSTTSRNTQGTFAQSSGKWYYEVDFTNNTSNSSAIGWARINIKTTQNIVGSGGGLTYRPGNGDYFNLSGTQDTAPPTTSTGNVLQVAIDFDAGKIWFGSGGTYFNSGNPSDGSNPGITFTGGSETLAPVVRTIDSTFYFNFGQRPFSYSEPTGYKSLCSENLPTPTIVLPTQHFDSLLYTGTGLTHSITGLNFAPDWVWIKERSSNSSHTLADTVRGAQKVVFPNATNAEETGSSAFSSFDSNGFTHAASVRTNESGQTYVAWNWNAGSSDGKTYTVTVVDDSGNKFRFDGYDTSAVTLDLAEGGTYVFNYPSSHPFRFSTTADGTHGGGSEYTTGVTSLSSTSIQIVVAASAPTLYYYCSNHSGMGGAINTNSTSGSSNFEGDIQSTVKVNSTAGISVGLYTGSGTSGDTVGTGLVDVAWVMLKNRSSGSSAWLFYTDLYNGTYDYLILNDTDAISSSSVSHTLTNTFKISTSISNNTNGDNYVFYALSEVKGFSSFGTYTGNSSSDGIFINTDFRPAFLMIKGTSNTGNWVMYDSKRDAHNLSHQIFYANTNQDEGTGSTLVVDLVSNGFKIRGSTNTHNSSSRTYIYFAFAESPFKFARAR